MKTFGRILAVAALAAAWGCGGEDEKPAAEKVGAFLGDQTAKLAEGIGEGLAKNGDAAGKGLAEGGGSVLGGAGEGLAANGEETGAKVAEGVGSVLKGVLKGLDKALAIAVEPGAGLADAGVAVARVDQGTEPDGRPRIDVYVTLSKPFAGALALDLVDEGGVKLGSATAEIKGAAGETVVAKFLFEPGSRAGFPGVRHVLRVP